MIPKCPEYKIGLTAATMYLLEWHNIPAPISHTYIPYAIVRMDGDGRQRGYGFPTASWTWSLLSQSQLYYLLELFDNDTDASVQVYIYTYKDTGYEADMGTFQCWMHRPVDGQGKSLVPNTRQHWANITITFTRMNEV